MASSENWGLRKIVTLVAGVVGFFGALAGLLTLPDFLTRIDVFRTSAYWANKGGHVTITWRVKGLGAQAYLNGKPVATDDSLDAVIDKPETFTLTARGIWGHDTRPPIYVKVLTPDPPFGNSTPQPRTEPPSKAACGLGHEWEESEYGYTGTWIRQDLTNRFDARWVLGNIIRRATLDIRMGGMDGRDVYIRRYEHGDPLNGGICEYDGILEEDLRTVKGTYHCTWSPESPPWSAVIKCQ